jgi:uncharacterized damage-inducible protein DinB
MTDFFVEKFELDYHSNELIVRSIEEQEDHLPTEVIAVFSHIINMHHIWLVRLTNGKAESDAWDKLPIAYLSDLNRHNYLETLQYIQELENHTLKDKFSSNSSDFPLNSADVLFHILQHSAYHRGQVIRSLKVNKLTFPSMQWIPID